MIVYMLELFEESREMGTTLRPEIFADPKDAAQRALTLFAYPGDEADLDGSPLWAICTDWDGQEELEVDNGGITIVLSPVKVQ